MKHFIKVDQDGEIITLIETSMEEIVEASCYPIKEAERLKIGTKPYNFRFKKGKLIEKNAKEKELEEVKRVVVPSVNPKIQDLENRLAKIETDVSALKAKTG